MKNDSNLGIVSLAEAIQAHYHYMVYGIDQTFGADRARFSMTLVKAPCGHGTANPKPREDAPPRLIHVEKDYGEGTVTFYASDSGSAARLDIMTRAIAHDGADPIMRQYSNERLAGILGGFQRSFMDEMRQHAGNLEQLAAQVKGRAETMHAGDHIAAVPMLGLQLGGLFSRRIYGVSLLQMDREAAMLHKYSLRDGKLEPTGSIRYARPGVAAPADYRAPTIQLPAFQPA